MDDIDIPAPPPHPIALNLHELIVTLLSKDNERLALILRSHLVLENVMEWACKKRLKNKSILERNTYSNKLKLLKSLYGNEIDNGYYETCKKLNKLRNEYAHELEETKHKDLYFDILNQNILNMGGRGKDNFQNISAKQQDEIFFYKIHHTALGIMEVSHVDEVQSYETQMQNWIETYLR